jgi:LacI family transcriptional regulator
MRPAVQHLAGLGHRALGIIAGPFMVYGEPERVIGFRRAMRAAGLPLERRRQFVARAFADEQAIAATNALLHGGARPTALVVTSTASCPVS